MTRVAGLNVYDQLSEISMNYDIDRDKVNVALDQVLQDDKFMLAPKSSALLHYVVTETLDGNAERIKAYSIAVDALNKPPCFDPQENPCVRVMAKRVRGMLDDYYSRTSGHEILLELKPGSYIPKFIVPEYKIAKVG